MAKVFIATTLVANKYHRNKKERKSLVFTRLQTNAISGIKNTLSEVQSLFEPQTGI